MKIRPFLPTSSIIDAYLQTGSVDRLPLTFQEQALNKKRIDPMQHTTRLVDLVSAYLKTGQSHLGNDKTLAVLMHKAVELAKKIDERVDNKSTLVADISELEAGFCQKIAAESPNPTEKLFWLVRGAQALPPHSKEASTLWNLASKVALVVPLPCQVMNFSLKDQSDSIAFSRHCSEQATHLENK